ncbi:PocR ligand-binding domain-containing protein [Deltaproteobacteria bacterium IMCC39524]|nr:PocR ligand-binding domain-containing protein [Deltaproteobacteria bacterium IMCC39524]
MKTTSNPPNESTNIKFQDLFDLDEIQSLQDAFAKASGVASIITNTDGRPITKPSNFCRLCIDIIRKTEKGLNNCMTSDALLGRGNPNGPTMQPCLSGGLWDGGASIMVGDKHVANWLIGQVRNEEQDVEGMLDYAREIGADEEDFLSALAEVNIMSTEQFSNVCQALFLMAKQLSTLAYQNILQERTIDERDVIADALRESEERSRLLLNSTAEAIYGLDKKGNCIFCNPACLKILGYESDTDLLGKNMHELIHHHRQDGTEYPEKECKAYQPFLRGEGLHVDDEVLWRADGSHFDAEYSAYPIRKGEEVIGSVITFHDISERKKAQADLIEAKKSAEEANAAKSNFLANISHEIRTPITVFMSAIEHLLEIDKDPKCQEVLDLAHISSKRLYVLLNEILDHSKIESHQLELEEEIFKVRKCLNETIEMMNDRAQKKHLNLALDVSPSVPEYMLGDPYRLGQILLNLIGNAIKFTEKGEITVNVIRHDGNLQFNVIDTGMGISEDMLEDIFESFRQVDSSSTRKHGGAGLGLAISKGLTELMGGEIRVQSELEQGSVFSFTLPLKNIKN